MGEHHRGRHDRDFVAWTREQADLLRAIPHETSPLDLGNLVEEIEDMGRSEIREVSNLLRQTLLHLLKIAIDPDAPSAMHWFDEVIAFQGDAALVFSPGLARRIDLPRIWRVACNGATRSLAKHGISAPPLPRDCPLSLDALVDPAFDPDAAVASIATAVDTGDRSKTETPP
ncbi:DUF29 domain-containing protein [Rhodoplanes roseus]|uniref:DUF29 domain-containing protein n=1 Tax=Rhodoplanes roseus TaxID=29409 RepID=A0A327KTK8_9BRAD|nr:DUF29 domain-containing protein [Rhodoplanes roseus]RAI41681.1 hypothetical protein CH341_21185 [Rhodoplanes roseus]